jgi:alcohol dehydrogenase class IV
MMQASLHAGLAFSNAILGAVHAIAHSLGGMFDSPHGECNALLLPHVVAFNYEACPERYDRIARVMGVSGAEGSALPLMERITDLNGTAGITRRLADLGVRSEDLPELAEKALRDACMATNPRTMTNADVEGILRAAL